MQKFIFKVGEASWLAFDFINDNWFVTPDPEKAFYTDAAYVDAYNQKWAESKVEISFDCWEIQELI